MPEKRMWRESLLATNTGTFPRIKRIPSRRLRSSILWHIFSRSAIGPAPQNQPTCNRTPEPPNRRFSHHKTTAKLHQGLKRIAIRFNNRRGICPRLKPLLEITRLFTFKGVPLIGKKNVKSRKNHFIHRPESRHRAIKRGRLSRRTDGSTIAKPPHTDPFWQRVSDLPCQNHPRPFSSHKPIAAKVINRTPTIGVCPIATPLQSKLE